MAFMRITSSVFEPMGSIPVRYTCDGDNVSPPFSISGVPQEAKSLVLIMDDPDVPKNVRPDGLWVHWVMWNIDPKIAGIGEDSVPPGAIEGATSSGRMEYGGPCPPDREHRYFFKLYALDTLISLPSSATKEKVEQVMEGHVLAKAELIGRYDRKR